MLLFAILIFMAGLIVSGIPAKITKKFKKAPQVISSEDYTVYSFINAIDKLFCSVDDVSIYGEFGIREVIKKRKIVSLVMLGFLAMIIGVVLSDMTVAFMIIAFLVAIFVSSNVGQKQLMFEKQDALERSVVEVYPLFASKNIQAAEIFSQMVSRYGDKVKAPDTVASLASMRKVAIGVTLLEAFEEWVNDAANTQLRKATETVAEIIIEDRAIRRIEKAASVDKKLAAPNTFFIFATMSTIMMIPIALNMLSSLAGG